MPILQNPGHACRLARRRDIAARIAELRNRREAADDLGAASLMAALREARSLLAETRRLLKALDLPPNSAISRQNPPEAGEGRGAENAVPPAGDPSRCSAVPPISR
jgi:hypothetical protein